MVQWKVIKFLGEGFFTHFVDSSFGTIPSLIVFGCWYSFFCHFTFNKYLMISMSDRSLVSFPYSAQIEYSLESVFNCWLPFLFCRTRTLVLELLAAVCFVSGGHEIILRAFDNFKTVTGESRRFETLLHYYQYEDFHIGELWCRYYGLWMDIGKS